MLYDKEMMDEYDAMKEELKYAGTFDQVQKGLKEVTGKLPEGYHPETGVFRGYDHLPHFKRRGSL